MKKYPINWVTEETFPLYWDYTDSLRRTARRRFYSTQISDLVCSLLFLLGTLYVVGGLSFSGTDGAFHDFCETIPNFTTLWSITESAIFVPGQSVPGRFIRYMLAIYILLVALHLTLSLVIPLFCRPRKLQQPEGSFPEKTVLLADLARQASTEIHKPWKFSAVPALTFVLAAAAVFFGYANYLGNLSAALADLSHGPTGSAVINAGMYLLVLYFLGILLSSLFLVVPHWSSRARVSYKLTAETEGAVIFSREESAEAFDSSWAAACKEKAPAYLEQAITAELNQNYTQAKALYLKAALCSDVTAMEHYARHCLIGQQKEAARFWLDCAIASRQASANVRGMRLRLWLNLPQEEEYLQPEEPPLTHGQQEKRKTLLAFTILWRGFMFVVLALVVLILIVLIKSDMDIGIFTDISEVARVLFG